MTAAHEQRLGAIQEFREPLSRLARRMEISRMTERDWDRIEQAGYTQFVATPVAEASPRHRVKLRGKRHEQYSEAYRNFRDVMESDNPPQSKEEAIRQVVGLIGKLLAIIFPQYALLISIIGFLWDVSTGTRSTISGVAIGASEGRV